MRLIQTICVALILITAPSVIMAQDKVRLSIELNNMTPAGTACRTTFLIKNELAVALDDLAFELVLFGKDQRVVKLVTVSTGKLPLGKSRVKQFDLKDLDCTSVGRVLLNDITRCRGDDLTPEACLAATTPSSRMEIPFIV